MKVLVFGNSGSGKTTIAKRLAQTHSLEHFDLDSIAWLPGQPPVRAPLDDSNSTLLSFIEQHDHWVIEGCYADLMELLFDVASEMIFMNLTAPQCIANATSRPWEPHKYESKAAQDQNFPLLIDWIKAYYIRSDECSLAAHIDLYQRFSGKKKMIRKNETFTGT